MLTKLIAVMHHHFIMYVRRDVVLYTLNCAVWQLYLNKTKGVPTVAQWVKNLGTSLRGSVVNEPDWDP